MVNLQQIGMLRNNMQIYIHTNIYTAWKLFKYGVFFGPYIPPFRLNAEIHK